MKEEFKMTTIDKNTLSKSVASRVGLTISDISDIIDIFQDEVIDAIKNYKKVQLNGFLIFIPKNVEGGKIVSPLDKKEYELKPKRTVIVRVGKYFRDSIKDSYVVEEKTDDSDKKERGSRKSKTSNK